MPRYRVLRGTYRRADGTRAEPGDIIEVSEERFSRLPSDSYERVDEDETTVEENDEPDETIEPQSERDSESESTSDSTGITPESVLPYDDYRLLSKMAALEESDDVHGAMSSEEIIDYFERQSGPYVADLLSEAESAMGDE